MRADTAPTDSTSPRSSSDSQPGDVRRVNAEAAIDDALVRRFAEGDETAFVEIMTRHHRKIFAVVLNLLHNRSDAEEITQDTFIRAHRGLANFRGDSSFTTWLYRIAINLARNRYWYHVTRRRQDSLSLDCELSEGSKATFSDLLADARHDPAQETAAIEFSVLVEHGMARLEARHREILILRNVLNCSYREIAVTLGTNVGTVRSRIARARENLRALLAGMCPEFSVDAVGTEWFLPSRAIYGQPAIASA